MKTIETKGFVMNVFAWKDHDRLLHLLTPELGLITANARGSASMKSKLRSLTQLFSLSDFILIERQGRYTVRSGVLQESFAGISFDLDRLAAASHAAEAFSDVARNGEPQRYVFDLWAYAIYQIATGEDPVFASRLATFRLMVESGFAPMLNACVRCLSEVSFPCRFSFREGGLICDQSGCRQAGDEGVTLSEGTVALLRYVTKAPFSRLFLFQASDLIREEASDFADQWLEKKMEKPYRRLSLVDQSGFRLNDECFEQGEK